MKLLRVWHVGLLLTLAVLLIAGMAPPVLCNQGNCPIIESGPDKGACDPAVTLCGTIKRFGTCTTGTRPNGTKTCRCVGPNGK